MEGPGVKLAENTPDSHTTGNVSCDSLVDFVISPMEKATPNSDGNRAPASDNAVDTPNEGTPAGTLDRPSVQSLLDGVLTSSFRGQAAPRPIGDGDGLDGSLSYSTAVSRHRDQSVATHANGVGGYPPTMNIVNSYGAAVCRTPMVGPGGGGRATATAGGLAGGGSSLLATLAGGSAATSKSGHPPVVPCSDRPLASTTFGGGPSTAHGLASGAPASITTTRIRPPALTPFGAPLVTAANRTSDAPPTIGTSTSTPPHFATGIAAGDGDLMPPRFNGDRRTDAEDWLQDMINYVAIRRLQPADATLLIRARLTGAARTWSESVPADASFDDIAARFRKRFGAGGSSKPELMTEFWERRQAPDEPAGAYIEDKARLARRMRLGNEPFVLQGIVQGLRADIRRDVMLLQPTTLEGLIDAAAIGEANAKASALQAKSDNADLNARLTEMQSMMTAMQAVILSQQPPTTVNHAAESAAMHPPQPRPASTTVAGRSHYRPADMPPAATALTTPSTTSSQQPVTVQLVMPDSGTATRGGRGGRGRDRGWRSSGRDDRPSWQNPLQVGQAAPNMAGIRQPPTPDTTYQPTPTPDNAAATSCPSCGLMHINGNCRAAFVLCFECQSPGHYARCCPRRQNPNLQH